MIAFARRYFWSTLFGAWAVAFEWLLVDNIWNGHNWRALAALIGMVVGFALMTYEALTADDCT
jgi:hypothetical protein